jgi:hypothetical protein
MYPEVIDTGKGEGVLALYGTPGLKPFCTLPWAGPVRGLHALANGRVFAVQGMNLYEVFDNATYVEKGDLLSTTGAVHFADNGSQMVFVDGPKGYVYTIGTDSLASISDADFVGATHVQFLDGYFIFNKPEQGQFYISQLYGVGFDALDFATAEGHPDRIVSLLVDHRELWLFGTTTTEIWINTGNADFPIDRMSGAFIEHGCLAPYSVAKLDNTVFWLGQDSRGRGIVWRAQGYNPERISNHAVEAAFATYTTLDQAVAYTYQQEGHSFYVLTCPEGTWATDVASGVWHERASLDPTTGQLGRHRAQYHVMGFGKHLVSDYADGRLYELDLDYYLDDTTVIPRIRQGAPIINDRNWLYHHSFELVFEAGVGLDAGTSPGADPQLMLEWSDDGGQSWSESRWLSAGKIGARAQRAVWRRLGRSRERVYRVTQSDPVKTAWLSAWVEAAGGRA